MNSNFKLLNKCYRFIEYYDDILLNFSKKNMVLKNCIEKTYYEMIENLFAYNINTTDRIKDKYIKDFLIKLSMIDFYTKVGFYKKNISLRQFEILGMNIVEMRKMTYGIINGL